MRRKQVFNEFVLDFFNVFSALSVYFNISNTGENHIFKSFMNNFNQQMKKWSDFSEKMTPSIVRFGEN